MSAALGQARWRNQQQLLHTEALQGRPNGCLRLRPQQCLGSDPASQPSSLPFVPSERGFRGGYSVGMEQPGLKVKISPAAPFTHPSLSSGRV